MHLIKNTQPLTLLQTLKREVVELKVDEKNL